METATKLSKTARRLNDSELGLLQRRVNEIIRRVEEGSVELDIAARSLQSIIENKTVPVVIYARRAEPSEFRRQPENKRKKSLAKMEDRLPHSRTRLEYPQRNDEHLMAEMWEAENIPHGGINFGAVPINAILNENNPSERDVQIVNSTIQWLATNCGRTFLVNYVRVSQIFL